MEQRGRRGSVTLEEAGSPSLSLLYSQLSSPADCIPPSFPLRLPLVSQELEVGQICSHSFIIHHVNRATGYDLLLLSLCTTSELVLFFCVLHSLSGLCSLIPFMKLVIYVTRSCLLPRLNTNWGSLTLKQRLFCWFHLKLNVLNKVCWWILPAMV